MRTQPVSRVASLVVSAMCLSASLTPSAVHAQTGSPAAASSPAANQTVLSAGPERVPRSRPRDLGSALAIRAPLVWRAPALLAMNVAAPLVLSAPAVLLGLLVGPLVVGAVAIRSQGSVNPLHLFLGGVVAAVGLGLLTVLLSDLVLFTGHLSHLLPSRMVAAVLLVAPLVWLVLGAGVADALEKTPGFGGATTLGVALGLFGFAAVGVPVALWVSVLMRVVTNLDQGSPLWTE
jgi:hypothetical protein